MLVLLIQLTLSQLEPGPLDAFKANYASTKVEMDFDFSEGQLKADGGKLWKGQEPIFVGNPATRIVGRWKCDGRAEYFFFSSPEEVLDRASKDSLRVEAGKIHYSVRFVPKTEAIWDGELLCWHLDHPHQRRSGGDSDWKRVTASPVDRELGQLEAGRGPLNWGFCAFPNVLKRFGGVKPSRQRATRWGLLTDVEVYRDEVSEWKDWLQTEVSYDPTIGYLPRFFRTLSYSKEQDKAGVEEVYVTDARPCSAGGFVPTEWYSLFFFIDGFRARYPDYNVATDFDPQRAEIGAGHFRASNVKDFSGPVALTEIVGVHSVLGVGGQERLPRKPSLSFKDVRTLLGNRLTTPQQRFLPNLDQAEIQEMEKISSVWRLTPVLAGLGIAVALVLTAVRLRRTKFWAASLILAVLTGSSGCGAVRDPVIKMTAGYDQPVIYIDTDTLELPVKLALKNEGNVSVRVSMVDGGCICRKVDQSRFPIVLKPGKGVEVPVKMTITPMTAPQQVQFALVTDRGNLAVTPKLYTLLSHQFLPDSIGAAAISEDSEWSFEFTHRAIFRANEGRPKFGLKFPSQFSVIKGNPRGGRVGGLSEFLYEDVDYQVALNDRTLGDHKEVIALTGPDGGVRHQVPVVWTRTAYLSTMPSRVSLASRAVRVFLLCPDERVELTKVLSAPKGIKAVVCSPRELTVAPDDGAPGVIDGTVEVGTTAAGRPPLFVRVARYDPPVTQ